MRSAARVGFSLSGRNLEALDVAAEQAARMITRVSAETRRAIQAIIVRSIREGIAPLDAAALIRRIIGLNRPQALAAKRYQRELRARGLAPSRVEQLLEFYVARKLRERSVTIARYEIMEALNVGSLHVARERRAAGLLDDPVKTLIVSQSSVKPPCKVCAAAEGQVQPLDRPFVLITGKKKQVPPFHPRCRCTAPVTERR